MKLSFLAAAREAPEAVAVVAAGRAWSFAELAPHVAAWVAALASAREESRWAAGGPYLVVDAAPTLPVLLRLWAAFHLGVPVALLHPRWTAAERARAVAAVPDPLEVSTLPGGKRTAEWGEPAPEDERPLAVVFTSGTTGAPKGVVLSRAAVVASAEASAARLGWEEGDRWWLSLAPAHVGGLSIVTRCLAARRTVVLAPELDPPAQLELVRQQRVTLLSLVAAQLRRLLDAHGGKAPESVRAVLVGGGPCPLPLLAEAWRRGWPVLPTYGLTEACSQVATAPPGWRPQDGLALPPLPGVQVRVVAGEVQVRGPTVCSGLVPAPAHPSPFTPDGWLRTGDLGWVDAAGRVEVRGRRDTVIVTGGEKVAPEEVEAALLAVPGVREALVFGIEDPVWGSLVAAAVVPVAGASLEPAALQEGVRGLLAPYKLPRRLAVVPELPRLPTGKPDRAGAAARLGGVLERGRGGVPAGTPGQGSF